MAFIWNELATFLGRVCMIAVGIKLALLAFGIEIADIGAGLTSIGG
jgi:hypothetical protein